MASKLELVASLASLTAEVASNGTVTPAAVAQRLRTLADRLAPPNGAPDAVPMPAPPVPRTDTPAPPTPTHDPQRRHEAPPGRPVGGQPDPLATPAPVRGATEALATLPVGTATLYEPPTGAALQLHVDGLVGVDDAALLGAKVWKRKELVAMVARSLVRYWIARTGRDPARTKVSDGRVSKVASRLNAGYSVDDIKQAIANIADSDHHSGTNDRNQRYDTIELICRNDEKLEWCRDLGNAPLGDSEVALDVDPVERAKLDAALGSMRARLRQTAEKMKAAMKSNDHHNYARLENEHQRLQAEIRGLQQGVQQQG